MSAIEIDGLCVRYGRTYGLYEFGCRIGAGATGLLGINGAGKTTLLRVLATTLRPSDGKVVVLGEDIRSARGRKAVRAQLGYVPQNLSLPGNLAVHEAIHYMAWLHGVPRAQRAAAVGRAIDRCELGPSRHRRTRELSGGTARRVVLAQALVHEPRLLLLDEPTTGLDPEQRILFRRLLADLPAGTVTVLSTHLIEDVARVASHVLVIEQGRLAYNGTVEDLTTLGEASEVQAADALERGFLASRMNVGVVQP